MRIHKAWYGPNGGHALLASSAPALQSVFRQAAWLTDLPGTAPTGLEWQPYFRTAIHDGYFVLIHTRASHDTSRAGMVDSVAAFVPLADLPLVPNIRALAQHLTDSHSSEDRAPFESGAHAPTTQLGEYSPMLRSITATLMGSNARPVVHVGQEGFDDLMLDLLQVIPKHLRREVLFSLCFSPEHSGECIAVSTPSQLASRFPQAQVLVPASEPPTIGIAALLNMPEGQPLLKFGEAAAFDLQSVNSFLLLEQAFRLWNSVDGVGDAISLVRVLAAKAGASTESDEVLRTSLDRLADMVAQWTATDVLSMRNLQLERFEKGRFTSAVQEWVRKHCNQAARSEQHCRLLEQAARGAAQQQWWNTHVLAGFASALNGNRAAVCALAWEAIERFPEGLTAILKFLEEEARLPALGEYTPTFLAKSTADAVAQHGAEHNSWQLSAAALAAAYDPEYALVALLKLGPPKAVRAIAFETALSKASKSSLLRIAALKDITEITTLAANAVADEPSLMGKFDWKSHVWFDILGQTVGKNRAAAKEVPNKLQGLEGLIKRGEQSERVWNALAVAGLADLSQVANRPDAWALIPHSTIERVLSSTAKGWLAELLNGKARVSALEEPLRSNVLALLGKSDAMSTLAQKSPVAFISVVDELYPQSDRQCTDLLEALARAGPWLDQTVTTALGKRIAVQLWRSSAGRAASFGRSRDDFLPVCIQCLDIMPLWDRLFLGPRLGKPVKIPTEEAWQMLTGELVRLYPRGPTYNEFWSRSGGKEEELSLDGTGVAQWHRCIKDVRAGRGPKAADLLRTAIEDFSGNPTLQMLQHSRALDSIV